MASPSTDQSSPLVHANQRTESTAVVEHEDDYEKVNASLQVTFSDVMEQSGYYKSSSFYKHVKCLLISWNEDSDDLNTDDEVSKLANVLENDFNYKVIRKLLSSTSGKLPHAQLNKYVADFIFNEDAYKTLLLVYYAGHGSPKSVGDGGHGLTLSGQRSPSENPKEVNEIVWKRIEGNLQRTEGDVLEIFDCCYAGDLCSTTRQTVSHRSFEFLGACPSGNTTLAPGPGSFTTALIWSLQYFFKKQTRFLVSELSEKIREAPGFPEEQVPVTMSRDTRSLEHMMLAPVSETCAPREEPPISPGSQGLLNLNFIFDEPPTKDLIVKFGRSLNKFMWASEMPVNRVVWGGLTTWGVHLSPGAHRRKITAAKLFKAGGLRRKLERRRRESEHRMTARLQTPNSNVEDTTQSSGPSSEIPKAQSKKRKLSSAG